MVSLDDLDSGHMFFVIVVVSPFLFLPGRSSFSAPSLGPRTWSNQPPATDLSDCLENSEQMLVQ